MLKSRLLTLTVAIFWCFCSFSSLAQEKHEDLPHPQTLADLQKAMKDVLDKNHVPGAGIALISRGELLWCGGLGKADIAANREITCATEFRAGSISKTFVALALLKLEEEGRINLNARLQDVAPEIPLQNRWESANPVRIVNLLAHTAGFDDMSFSETYNTDGAADVENGNVRRTVRVVGFAEAHVVE